MELAIVFHVSRSFRQIVHFRPCPTCGQCEALKTSNLVDEFCFDQFRRDSPQGVLVHLSKIWL